MRFADYLAAVKAFGVELELEAPAGEDAVRGLDAACGAPVPDELRAAWMAADGSGRTLFARPDFYTGYELLSVAQARAEREGLRRRAPRYAGYVEPGARDPRIRDGWFQPGWLPFAGFGGATLLLMVDLSPADAGRVGQVIAFTHDPDEISYVAGSFEELLDGSLAMLEADLEEFYEDDFEDEDDDDGGDEDDEDDDAEDPDDP